MDVFESSMSCCVGNMSATKKAWSFPSCPVSHLNSEMKYVMEISPQCDWNRNSQNIIIGHAVSTKCDFVQMYTECIVAMCFLVSTKENLNEFHYDTVVSCQQENRNSCLVLFFQTTYI